MKIRERLFAAGVGVGVVAPVAAAGLRAIGAPWIVVGAIVGGLAFLAMALLPRRLPAALDGAWSGGGRRRLVCVLWMVLGLAAVVQSARMSAFMWDASRAGDSLMPGDDFLVHHCCFTAYYEGARLAGNASEVPNIYLPELYKPASDPAAGPAAGPADGGGARKAGRKIGPFNVDFYQYPPSFLLAPRAIGLVAHDFYEARTLWFVLQALLLLGSLLAAASWIGGREGLVIGLLAPLAWISLPIQATLQIGNAQIMMIAASLLAMIAFARGHRTAGAFMLAFAALGKIFPGILFVYLIVRGRFKDAAWTAAAAAVLLIATLLLFGAAPFEMFNRYQLPRIESGEAFPMLARAGATVASNFSFSGIVLKLAMIGVPGMTPSLARAVSWAYSALVVLLAVLVARRSGGAGGAAGPASRLREVQSWLALVILASLRSPFVPQEYGPAGALLLLACIAAAGSSRRRAIALAAAGFAGLNLLIPQDVPMNNYLYLAVATIPQVITIGLALFVLTRAPRAPWPVLPKPAEP